MVVFLCDRLVLFSAVWIVLGFIHTSLAAPITGDDSNDKGDGSIEKELLSLQPSLKEGGKPQEADEKVVLQPSEKPPSISQDNVLGNEPPPVVPEMVGNNEQPKPIIKTSTYQQVLESPAIDLTPEAVAEYLVLTGDFDGLDMALLDLVRSKILSLYEVEQYKEAVGLEYEKMLQQILDAETSYIQAFNLLYGDEPSVKDAQVMQRQSQQQQQQQQLVEQQQQQPQAQTVIQVDKLTGVAIQDPSLPSVGALPMEQYVQSVADQASEKAKLNENNELDKLMEWLNNEMGKQHQQPVMQKVESVKIAGVVPGGQPIIKQAKTIIVGRNTGIEQDKTANNENPLPGLVQKSEVVEVPPQAPAVNNNDGDLENRDNQGKMVIKETLDQATA